MNLKQAKRIITNFESAIRADEMKGAGDPDDIVVIEVELEMARYKLNTLITVLLSHAQANFKEAAQREVIKSS